MVGPVLAGAEVVPGFYSAVLLFGDIFYNWVCTVYNWSLIPC